MKGWTWTRKSSVLFCAKVHGLQVFSWWQRFSSIALWLAPTSSHSLRQSEEAFSPFIFSPWKYLRKTIGELSLGAENPRLLDTDHYLLNRFISNLQVALILLVVFGVGVVVTAAVHAMLPPFYLRQQLAQTQKSLTAAQGSLQTHTSTQVKQQDNDWQTRRAELISKAKMASTEGKNSTGFDAIR